MTVGTPLHERTAPLNRKQSWREWSGYLAASAYDFLHLHEYIGIRHAAVLIDVSPLYKYNVRGPDAVRLIDRVITRDATKIKPGQVIYTPWCDDFGKVIDDGTIARLDDESFRWTSAEQHLRWFQLNARGLDVHVEDISEATAASSSVTSSISTSRPRAFISIHRRFGSAAVQRKRSPSRLNTVPSSRTLPSSSHQDV